MRCRLGLMLILVGSLAVVTDAGRAAQQPDMPQSYLFGAGGTLTPLRSATTYRASQFPIPLRLKPGAGGWSGAQWKSGKDYFRGGASTELRLGACRPRLLVGSSSRSDHDHDRIRQDTFGRHDCQRPSHPRSGCQLPRL